MSELSSHHQEPQHADVVDLSAARRAREGYREPDQVSDQEAVELFLSQVSRMGAPHEPEALGRYVRKLLGDSKEDSLTEEQIAWRARMLQAMVDIDDVDMDQLDQWLEEDEVLGLMYATLRDHQHAGDRAEERKALMQLRHLRAGVLHRGEIHEAEEARWDTLVRRLGHQALQ